jgi:hypothetical protein
MNRIIEQDYPLFRLYQQIRRHLMASLSDAELAFTPGGDNLPLGRLCVDIGQTQQSYINSFRTFTLDFDYRHPEADELAGSVERLKAWYKALDDDLYAAVASLDDDTIDNHPIDRGGNFTVPAGMQLEVYKQALLIFYARCDVYLRLMGITPSEQWREWLG